MVDLPCGVSGEDVLGAVVVEHRGDLERAPTHPHLMGADHVLGITPNHDSVMLVSHVPVRSSDIFYF